MTLTIGIPCISSSVHTNTIVCVQNLLATMKKQEVRVWVEQTQPTMEQAESMLLSAWMGGNVSFNDYFLLLHPDMYFTEKDISNMINLRAEAVFANYAKSSGESSAVIVKNSSSNPSEAQPLEFVTAPVGCVLLRKNVVTKIQKLLIKDNHSLTVTMLPNNQETVPFFKHRLINRSSEQASTKLSSVWMDDSYSFSWLIRQAGIPITGYQSNTLGCIRPVLGMKKCRHSNNYSSYKNPPLKPVVNSVQKTVEQPQRVADNRIVDDSSRFHAPELHPRSIDTIEKVSEPRKYMAPMLHPNSIEDLNIQEYRDS